MFKKYGDGKVLKVFNDKDLLSETEDSKQEQVEEKDNKKLKNTKEN